jgi:hypothetical protein
LLPHTFNSLNPTALQLLPVERAAALSSISVTQEFCDLFPTCNIVACRLEEDMQIDDDLVACSLIISK